MNVCQQAMTTRDCRFNHDWRLVNGVWTAFKKAAHS